MKKQEILRFFDCVGGNLFITTIKDKGSSQSVNGFFTDKAALGTALDEFDDDTTLFTNINVLSDDYIQRISNNKFGAVVQGRGFKAENITLRRSVVIDIDVHSSNLVTKNDEGCISTDTENRRSVEIATNIKNSLEDTGFVGVGVFNSGNGAYVVVPIEKISNDKENQEKIQDFVGCIKKEFSSGRCLVDESSARVAQLFKIPGKKSYKGRECQGYKRREASIIIEPDFSLSERNSLILLQQYTLDHTFENQFYSLDSHGNVQWKPENIATESGKHYDVFSDQDGNAYAQTMQGTKLQIFDMGTERFQSEIKQWVRMNSELKIVPDNAVTDVIKYLRDQAITQRKYALSHRVAVIDDPTTGKNIYYDLGDFTRAVKIDKHSATLVDYPLHTFMAGDFDVPQIIPDFSAKAEDMFSLVSPLVKLKTKSDMILLLVFLGSCMFGTTISHPIFFVEGSKGSSKSTVCKQIQRIINPKSTGLFQFPEKAQDLEVVVNHDLLVAFDNLGGFSTTISDCLCQIVTGTYAVRRRLFTNTEKSAVPLKNIIVMNGLELLNNKEDLNDRILILSLDRIPDPERKTDEEVWKQFDAALPKILGALFDATSRVLGMEDLKVESCLRLFDFQLVATKFGIAFGFNQDEITNAFLGSHNRAVEKVLDSPVPCFIITRLLKGKKHEQVSGNELYRMFVEFCRDNDILQSRPDVPRSDSALIRKLNRIQSELNEVGITFTRNHTGTAKVFDFYSSSSFTSFADDKMGADDTPYDYSDEE